MPKASFLRPIGLIIPPIGSHNSPLWVSKIPLYGLIIAPVRTQLHLPSGIVTPDPHPSFFGPASHPTNASSPFPPATATAATTPSVASSTPSPARRFSLAQRFLFRVEDQRNNLPLRHPRPALRVCWNVDRLEITTTLEHIIGCFRAFAAHCNRRQPSAIIKCLTAGTPDTLNLLTKFRVNHAISRLRIQVATSGFFTKTPVLIRSLRQRCSELCSERHVDHVAICVLNS